MSNNQSIAQNWRYLIPNPMNNENNGFDPSIPKGAFNEDPISVWDWIRNAWQKFWDTEIMNYKSMIKRK